MSSFELLVHKTKHALESLGDYGEWTLELSSPDDTCGLIQASCTFSPTSQQKPVQNESGGYHVKLALFTAWSLARAVECSGN